jgi:hypothetical protein
MSEDTSTPEQLVAALVDEAGSFVTKFVLVAEVIDPDGDRCVWCLGSDDLARWDSYGLLTEAIEVERAKQYAERINGEAEQ